MFIIAEAPKARIKLFFAENPTGQVHALLARFWVADYPPKIIRQRLFEPIQTTIILITIPTIESIRSFQSE